MLLQPAQNVCLGSARLSCQIKADHWEVLSVRIAPPQVLHFAWEYSAAPSFPLPSLSPHPHPPCNSTWLLHTTGSFLLSASDLTVNWNISKMVNYIVYHLTCFTLLSASLSFTSVEQDFACALFRVRLHCAPLVGIVEQVTLHLSWENIRWFYFSQRLSKS